MPIAKPLKLKLPRANLGEGADWDPASAGLFCVDIAEQGFHVIDVENGVGRSYDGSEVRGFAFPRMASALEAKDAP